MRVECLGLRAKCTVLLLELLLSACCQLDIVPLRMILVWASDAGWIEGFTVEIVEIYGWEFKIRETNPRL